MSEASSLEFETFKHWHKLRHLHITEALGL